MNDIDDVSLWSRISLNIIVIVIIIIIITLIF